MPACGAPRAALTPGPLQPLSVLTSLSPSVPFTPASAVGVPPPSGSPGAGPAAAAGCPPRPAAPPGRGAAPAAPAAPPPQKPSSWLSSSLGESAAAAPSSGPPCSGSAQPSGGATPSACGRARHIRLNCAATAGGPAGLAAPRAA